VCSAVKGEHRRLKDSIERMFPKFNYDSDYLPERDSLWPTEETYSDAWDRATRVLDKIFQSESQDKKCKLLKLQPAEFDSGQLTCHEHGLSRLDNSARWDYQVFYVRSEFQVSKHGHTQREYVDLDRFPDDEILTFP